MVFKVAQETFDQYFATQSATVMPTVPIASVSVAKTPKAPKAPKEPTGPPTQWHKIISNKELGVTAFFKSDYDEMKAAKGNINYFTAIKQIRVKYEQTPRWEEYRNWVVQNHPAPDTIQESKASSQNETGTVTTVTVQAS